MFSVLRRVRCNHETHHRRDYRRGFRLCIVGRVRFYVLALLITGEIMKTDFKVYPRKINVYYRNVLTGGEWKYCYSTNAYRTCREAREAALPSMRGSEVKTNFAKGGAA